MTDRRRRREALQCCPACAASLGNRRRRPGRHHGSRPPYAWLGLLGVVAAMVPVAAMDGPGGASVAVAAPAVAEAPPPAASPEPPRPAPAPRPARPAVEWRESLAHGTPNGGSLTGAVRLPQEGPGYYGYDPATQRPPGGRERQWGTAALVREVMGLGTWWRATFPGRPRLGIGDLSRPGGGPFTGPVVGHASHQNGLDVDIRLVRRDGVEGPADASSYDRALTQAVVDRLVARGADLVLIGPSLDLTGPSGVVVRWPNHDDHLHVRFPDPDGTGN
jgi:hypothetical protein